MENQFKKVEFLFGEGYDILLKEAMKITTSQTAKANTSIVFTEHGFDIIEPISEKFLFSFAMNYGKLLKKE